MDTTHVAEFEQLVPEKSPLGREWYKLKAEHETQRVKFENAPDKMDYDTSYYRRAGFALETFLDNWLPRVQKAMIVLDKRATDALAERALATQRKDDKHHVQLSRRTTARIWQHHALQKYRDTFPRGVKKLNAYHPGHVGALIRAWKTFRREMVLWKYGHQDFDASQAMQAMLNFFVQLDLLAASND